MQLVLQALTYHRQSDEPLSMLVILFVRVTLVVATGWLASRALARSSAAVQHRVWLLATLGMLVVPLLWALTPGWRVPLLELQVEDANLPLGFGDAHLSHGSSWPELLVVCWFVGLLVGLCYIMLGIISARRLFGGSAPCTNRAWLELLAALQRELGIARHIELRVTARSVSPAVWSFRRVQILLPEASLAWRPRHRRSVLLHELAHVARHDCASRMIVNLACAVWWFQPLAWFTANRVRVLGEQAADDYVIRAGSQRTDYAHQLLAIAGALGWARLPGLAQTMFHPSHLEQRLRAILDPARQRNALDTRRSLTSVAIACALVIPLATLTPSVVRAVPDLPVEEPRPASIDIYLKLRVTVPVTPIGLTRGYRRLVRPADPNVAAPPLAPEQPQTPPVPPPATFNLIPNWEVGRHAERLIPPCVPGTVQTTLVGQLTRHGADPIATE